MQEKRIAIQCDIFTALRCVLWYIAFFKFSLNQIILAAFAEGSLF